MFFFFAFFFYIITTISWFNMHIKGFNVVGISTHHLKQYELEDV
jgi:hypothetical protein